MSRSICVFCASSLGEDPLFLELAKKIGRQIAQRGDHLIYGGGAVGLMGVMANSCLHAKGKVTGIIPKHLNEREIPHKGLSDMIVVKDMFDRKSEMLDRSDGFIVLPGGFGTLDELFEMITLGQLGLHKKPIILLNVNRFFDPIINQIKVCMAHGFIKEEYLELFICIPKLEDAFKELDEIWDKAN
ncbi:MAG: TIGR00730 family Rossman fold protein [Deltaproteobacteria bacterium]|nr:TIGR00730 family Rossman fold protein [Deltaproteobacteria bacterium]